MAEVQKTGKRRGPAPPPADETKGQKFSRIASRRVGTVLDEIRKLETLADKNNYEFTPEQVQNIRNAIEAALGVVWDRFSGNVKSKSAFKV